MNNCTHKLPEKNLGEYNTKALVMFCDSNSFGILKLLKKGYKHCFIAVKVDKDWIIYEPLLTRTEISIIKNADIHYVRKCFEMMGCQVLQTRLNRTESIKHSIFTPFTCVSAVQRVLGVKPNFFTTPWKLYKQIAK